MSVVLINIHNGEWISLEFLNHWIEFKLLILWLSQDFPSSYFVWQIHSSLGIIPLSRLCLYMRQLILCDKMLIEFTIAPMDRGAWWATVHGVAKSRTRLNDFTFTFHFPALEKAMATHSSVLAWRIPGTGEPGGLPSMGSHRVGHDWSNSSSSSNSKKRQTVKKSGFYTFS